MGTARCCTRATLENPRAERAGGELHSEPARRVLAVEDWVHLDHFERGELAPFGDELHSEVRFAVREPSPNRRADTRGRFRVGYVQVERHVDERGTSHAL